MATVCIRGGSVLTGDGAFRHADILVENGMITRIEGELDRSAAQEIDARGAIVLPGLINAHTHAHGNLARGMLDSMTLEDMRSFGSVIAPARTVEDHYASAALGAIEMVKAGCTTAYDQFSCGTDPAVIEAVVQAYADVGMRAVLAPSVGDRDMYRVIPGLWEEIPDDLRAGLAFSPRSVPEIVRVLRRAVKDWHGTHSGRIRVGLAPSVADECTDGLLVASHALASEFGLTSQCHVAESKVQALTSLALHGKSAVRRFHDLGVLDERTVIGHGVWIDADDIALLRDAGSSVAHNPASNLRLGSGIAPVRELLDAGVNVGLGTGGSMSCGDQDMFAAMRFAGSVSTIRFGYEADRWVGAAEVWHMATEGGARLVDQQASLGRIEVGRRADIVVADARTTRMTPWNNPLNQLVSTQSGPAVRTVLVDGRVVADKGRATNVDESKILAQVQQCYDRNRAGAEERRDWALRLAPIVKSHCRKLAAARLPFERLAGAAAAHQGFNGQ